MWIIFNHVFVKLSQAEIVIIELTNGYLGDILHWMKGKIHWQLTTLRYATWCN
jgi:hypothetical protein